jgi:hypothetical protein
VFSRIKLVLIAMLYGLALATALSNTALLIYYVSTGRPIGSALPIALLGWGIILYLHRRMGWPPFH